MLTPVQIETLLTALRAETDPTIIAASEEFSSGAKLTVT